MSLATNEAARELHRILDGLPERVEELSSDVLDELPKEINDLYEVAIGELNIDPKLFRDVMDEVDDAKYPRWATVPADTRNQYANLMALSAHPDRYIPRISGTHTALPTVLLDAKERLYRLKALMDAPAQTLHETLDLLQRDTERVVDLDTNQLVAGVNAVFVSLMKRLGASTARLANISDPTGRRALKWRQLPEDVRNEVAQMKAICENPERFIPEVPREKRDEAFALATDQIRKLVAALNRG